MESGERASRSNEENQALDGNTMNMTEQLKTLIESNQSQWNGIGVESENHLRVDDDEGLGMVGKSAGMPPLPSIPGIGRQNSSVVSSISSSVDITRVLSATRYSFLSVEVAKKSLGGFMIESIDKATKESVWNKLKFLNDEDMQELDVWNYSNNCLGALMTATNRQHLDLEGRIKFWKMYGTTVQYRLAVLRSTSTRHIKDYIVKGMGFT